jgi:hypothetical protein
MGQRDDLVDALAFSFFTSAVMLATSSSIWMFGPGEAISGVSVVTAPTMPIFWPPTSRTTDGLILSDALTGCWA